MQPELKALLTSGYKKVMFYKIQHYTADSYAGWHRSLRTRARPYTYTPWTGTLHLPIITSTRKELLDWMFAHVDYGHYIMRGWVRVRRKKVNNIWKTGTKLKRLAEVTFQPAPPGSDRDYIARNVNIEPVTKLRWWGQARRTNRTDTYLTRTRRRAIANKEE